MTPFGRFLVLLFFTAIIVGCSSCGKDPVGPEDPGDTTRPTVTAVSPTANDSTVSLETSITAYFSEKMSQTSLVSGVILLDPATPGVTSSTDSSVTFTPTNLLITKQLYTATVNTTAADAAGNLLATAYNWQFATFPDSIPPTVQTTVPASGDSTATVNTAITATFSERMDVATLTLANFQLTPAATGSITATPTSLTFIPDAPLDTLQWYTATVTTGVKDSAQNSLATDYSWQFRTFPDTTNPLATIVSPDNNAVVGDSVIFQIAADDNDAVVLVEYYIDGAHVVSADDTEAPYQYTHDASSFEVGSAHYLIVKAYDGSGNTFTTDTTHFHYLWRLLVDDRNEGIPRNIHYIHYRTTPSQIQFRVETYNGWGVYNDDSLGVSIAIYIDSDQDSTTGDIETDSASPKRIGDIGADQLIVVGIYGLYLRQWTGSTWGAIEGLDDLNIADSTNVFDVSILHSRINNSEHINIIVAGVHVITSQWDWAPDLQYGHATIEIDHSYEGSPPARTSSHQAAVTQTKVRPSPFD